MAPARPPGSGRGGWLAGLCDGSGTVWVRNEGSPAAWWSVCRWCVWRRRWLLPWLFSSLLVLCLHSALLALPSLSRRSLYPPPRRLVDLAGFSFLVNTDVCGAAGPLRAVLVIHSDPRQPEARLAARRSLTADLLHRLRVRRVFMLADASHVTDDGTAALSQEKILAESKAYGHVVQGNFVDSYHNMTYKHVMALTWAITYCPQARWIVKLDDDTMFDVFRLLDLLDTLPQRGFIGGNLLPQSRPFRRRTKWAMSLQQWPHQYYPPYLSGGLYVLTPDVARRLVLQSDRLPFFWIDDVYVTGILPALLPDLQLTALNDIFVTESGCTERLVAQNFSLEEASAAPVLAPAFIVSIKLKNATVLERFNMLTLYCRRHACQESPPHDACFNRLRLKTSFGLGVSWRLLGDPADSGEARRRRALDQEALQTEEEEDLSWSSLLINSLT